MASTINQHRFRSLLFVGGEPTLCIPEINRILSGLARPGQVEVAMTTNGHFAHSKPAAIATLSRLVRLDRVQLSYDKYHQKFLPASNIRRLSLACRDMDIRFSVLVSIQSPMDLVILKQLRKAGRFPIGVQKVHQIGEAKRNRLQHPYPSFDESVLSKRCPSRGKLAYMCGEGYTTCCSYLSLQEDPAKYVHPTVEQHLESPFYGLLRRFTFAGLMRRFGIPEQDLLPEHSDPCNLCKFIFERSDGHF